MQRIELYLSEEMAAKLRRLSKTHRKTVSELIRETLVITYLSGKPLMIKKALKASRGLWEDRKTFKADRFIRTLREDTHRKKRAPHF